ncbi:hypothetical protein [Jiulongibacter sp. NS-SX5]|uniref:hypothetical protein n=1 Tax=Jiulongibacter sp. NS-SX5 TaxID=3463854 RepID=UPI004058994C
MKKLLYLFCLIIFCNSSFAQILSVNPVKLSFDLGSPNSTQTQVINITNNSDTNQALEVLTGDWIRNEDGGHSYYSPGTKPYSCANWISTNTNFLNIPPGETERIIVTLQAPENSEDLEKMKWGMLYLQGSKIRENVQDLNTNLQTKVNEVMRFGIHVYQTPPHLTQLSASVEGLEVNPKNAGVYNLQVFNTGSVMTQVKTFLELTNVETGQEYKGEEKECPIFPAGKRVVPLPLPKDLPKGQYSMLAILDYGDPNSLEAIEKIITIE